MDHDEIAFLAVLGTAVLAFLVSLALGGPKYRRAVARVAETAFRIRCWPFVRDPMKVMREYQHSLEHQSQQVANRIRALARRLVRRGVLSEDAAGSCVRSAEDAVERVFGLEEDMRELRRADSVEEWSTEVEEAARGVITRLESLHAAMAHLLAIGAASRSTRTDTELEETRDELDCLATALEEVDAGDAAARGFTHAAERGPHGSELVEPETAQAGQV